MAESNEDWGVREIMDLARQELGIADAFFEREKTRWRAKIRRYMSEKGFRHRPAGSDTYSYRVSESLARRIYADLRPYFYGSQERQDEWQQKQALIALTDDYLQALDKEAEQEKADRLLKEENPVQYALQQQNQLQRDLKVRQPSEAIVDRLMLRAIFRKLFPNFDLNQFRTDYRQGVALKEQLKANYPGDDRDALALREREIKAKLRQAYQGNISSYETGGTDG